MWYEELYYVIIICCYGYDNIYNVSMDLLLLAGVFHETCFEYNNS